MSVLVIDGRYLCSRARVRGCLCLSCVPVSLYVVCYLSGSAATNGLWFEGVVMRARPSYRVRVPAFMCPRVLCERLSCGGASGFARVFVLRRAREMFMCRVCVES